MVCNGYTYTQPRRPVGATYKGPGPCYALPPLIGHSSHDPRSSHSRGPAFQFGLPFHPAAGPCSPGPCYNPDSRLSRTGRDGGPSYSVYGRQKDLEPFRTPAPGLYPYHTVRPITKPSPPAYTFGGAWSLRPVDDNPGPSVYTLPDTTGKTVESHKPQAPSYSIYGRSKIGNFYDDIHKTPGPCAYRVTAPDKYKVRAPEYSVTGKNQLPVDHTVKPGPGTHSPEKVTIHRRTQPSFSFGIRHSEYITPILHDVCAE